MPTTSTAVNGCGVGLLIENEFGDMIDCSGSANSISQKAINILGEFKVFADSAMYRLECGTDWTLDFDALYTLAMREAMDLLKSWRVQRGQRRIRVCIPRNVSGADAYEGRFLYENINLDIKADDAKPIMSKVSVKPNGAVNYFKVP